MEVKIKGSSAIGDKSKNINHQSKIPKVANNGGLDSRLMAEYGVDYNYYSILVIYGFNATRADIGAIRNCLVHYLNTLVEETSILGKVNIIYFTQASKKRKESRSISKSKGEKPLDFQTFKKEVILKITGKQLDLIKSIMAVYEGFLSKSMRFLSFSKTYNEQFIDQIISYYDKLEDIVAKLGPLFDCEKLPEEVQEFNQTNQWLHIFNNEDKKQRMKLREKMFGMTDKKESRYLKSLQGYPVDKETGLPAVIAAIFKQISKSHSRQIGIFRKNCNYEKLQRLEQKVKESQYVISQDCLKEFDGNVLSSYLKNIFNELKTPIVHKTLFSQIYRQVSHTSRKTHNFKKSKSMLIGMPPEAKALPLGQKKTQEDRQSQQNMIEIAEFLLANMQEAPKNILNSLLEFLSLQIVTESKHNQMNERCLAIVFAPCIFREEFKSLTDSNRYKLCIKLLQTMICQWKRAKEQ